MGFIGVNPPAARVTTDGATSQARIASQVDATAKNLTGHVAFFKDDSGRISVLRYVQSIATIAKGAALMRLGTDGAGLLSSRNPWVVGAATIGVGELNVCAGFAAADVSNTSYYFWSYISGYCPDVAMPTSYASGSLMKLSATYAGRLSSAIINASNACTGGTLAQHIVAISLSANSSASANSTGSAIIVGWLM